MNNWEILDQIIRNANIVDLSPTIEHNMPRWITHPPITIGPSFTHEHDGYSCQTIVMGEHSGAHVDAPSHTLATMQDKTIDLYAPDIIVGPAIKYELYKFNAKPGDRIDADQILALEKEMGDSAKAGDIVLMDFGYQQYYKNDASWRYYATNAPGLSEDACKLFAERRVKAVGSDTLACDTPMKDAFQDYSYGHMKYFLPNEIFIMEILMNLGKLPVRCYFVAIPLKISNGSGSPIRPFAIV